MNTKMKFFTTVLTSAALCSTLVMAKNIDISGPQKDMRVMRGILESSLSESKKDFPGRPNIKATYLAEQGFLFTIRLNGLGEFRIPGVAAWDSGRLELDIPEIIDEAFAAIEDSGVIAPEDYPEMDEIMFHSDEELSAQNARNKALQEQLRAIRDQQRELRKETYRLSREARRAEAEEQRETLEKRLKETKVQLEEKKKDYEKTRAAYKKERNSKQLARSNKAIDSILQTFCDYGTTIRSLKKGEKVNLLIQGGVTESGQNASQMYIFDYSDIRNCKNIANLKKQALYYTI